MWHTLEFENKLEICLIKSLGEEPGKAMYREYATLRDTLIKDNVFQGISGAVPTLTDHSEKHVADVMKRVYKLLGEEPERYLTYSEYYLLAMLILFHDVGNIYGRKNHEENAAKVYSHFKGNANRQERLLLIKGIAAHSGFGKDGSKDTLKSLSNNESLNGEPIRLRELAALLRFGDELAEGRQRTSEFMLKNNLIKEGSEIYHKYAEITDIYIDRKLERVSITYHIDIDSKNYNKIETKSLIDFSLKRIHKLDTERSYNKNYSDLLQAFKFTTVEINICIDGRLISDLDFKKLELSDRFPIPDENLSNNYEEISNHFSSEIIIEKIDSSLN